MPSSATVAVVAGTRPELIKLAPVVKELAGDETFEPFLVHTGQHHDVVLHDQFFEPLGVPEPAVNLGVGSGPHADQTGEMIAAIGEMLREHAPEFTMAQGDTNTVLAAAVAASKHPTTFCHVEAGLRSFDRSMPEETNRVLADHVEGVSFTPTEAAAENLREEGVTEDVYVVGNTVVDACLEYRAVAREESSVLSRVGVEPGAYATATIHRPRNTDDPERLRTVLCALGAAPEPVVLPVHPRTEAAIERCGFESRGSLRLVESLDYLDFLRLLDMALLVVTDSGGVQEEASVLEVPCLTVRPSTERPETVEAGVNELVTPDELEGRLATLLRREVVREAMTGATGLYGDGNAAERIVELLKQNAER